jgi:hypothetical protein
VSRHIDKRNGRAGLCRTVAGVDEAAFTPRHPAYRVLRSEQVPRKIFEAGVVRYGRNAIARAEFPGQPECTGDIHPGRGSAKETVVIRIEKRTDKPDSGPLDPVRATDPLEITGKEAGSRATIRVAWPDARNTLATPISIPALPTPPQNASIGLSTCCNSSRPIPS